MTTENNFSIDESRFKIRSRRIIGDPEIPTMIRVLVKNNFVKTEKQAVAVILSIVLIFLIISGVLIKKSVSVPEATISPALLNNNK